MSGLIGVCTVFFFIPSARYRHHLVVMYAYFKGEENGYSLAPGRRGGGGVLAYFIRETTFLSLCLVFCAPSLIRKGIYPERKKKTPNGSKFFTVRVDPFSKGNHNN